MFANMIKKRIYTGHALKCQLFPVEELNCSSCCKLAFKDAPSQRNANVNYIADIQMQLLQLYKKIHNKLNFPNNWRA